MRVRLSDLELALDWVDHLGTAVSRGNFPPFFEELPAANRWGFRAEIDDVQAVLAAHMGIPSKDPTLLTIGLYLGGVDWEAYARSWARPRWFLVDNRALFGDGPVDLTAYLSRGIPPEGRDRDPAAAEDAPSERAATHFRHLLEAIAAGRLTRADLLAPPDLREHVD